MLLSQMPDTEVTEEAWASPQKPAAATTTYAAVTALGKAAGKAKMVEGKNSFAPLAEEQKASKNSKRSLAGKVREGDAKRSATELEEGAEWAEQDGSDAEEQNL